jgi:hypothetical protein
MKENEILKNKSYIPRGILLQEISDFFNVTNVINVEFKGLIKYNFYIKANSILITF